MTALAKESSAQELSAKQSAPNESAAKRRLLLASDRFDQSYELADILRSVGQVDTISTSEIPEVPAGHFSGIVVDVNLRSSESVQSAASLSIKARIRCRTASAECALFPPEPGIADVKKYLSS